jgi:hypothetical protein
MDLHGGVLGGEWMAGKAGGQECHPEIAEDNRDRGDREAGLLLPHLVR